jgi:hypothetical protein
MDRAQEIANKYITDKVLEQMWEECSPLSRTLPLDFASKVQLYVLRRYSVDFIRERSEKSTDTILKEMDAEPVDKRKFSSIVFKRAKAYKPEAFKGKVTIK